MKLVWVQSDCQSCSFVYTIEPSVYNMYLVCMNFSKVKERREAMFQRQTTVLPVEQYDYNYRLHHPIDATMSKLNEQHTQQLLTGVHTAANAVTTVVSVSSPYERDLFNSSENEYYKSWQTQRHIAQTQQLTSCSDSTLIGCSGDHVVDHIYESPNFARKDFKTFNKSWLNKPNTLWNPETDLNTQHTHKHSTLRLLIGQRPFVWHHNKL